MEVNLTKRVKTATGLRYCPVVIAANGRLKPDTVVVNGNQEKHPEGAYYIEWRENGTRVRLSVGKDAAQASTRRLQKQAELRANSLGIATASVTDNAGKHSLAAAVESYLEEIELTKKGKTHSAYSTSLAYFRESCHRLYLEDIERSDLLKFCAFLRDDKELSPRTCHNKFENVITFLKSHGFTRIARKGDWPQYVEEEPEVYEREELAVLCNACTSQERLWWEFFLGTGMREQEVMHTAWRNINFAQGTVTVTWKPEFDWTPKAYKEREIPISDRLLGELRRVKPKANAANSLLFPTAGGRPKLDFLDRLKACVKRAGLDPDNFWLHKFRATFATWALGSVDVRTVQSWLGHTDLKSTLRYLRANRGEAVRAKVNEIFAVQGAGQQVLNASQENQPQA